MLFPVSTALLHRARQNSYFLFIFGLLTEGQPARERFQSCLHRLAGPASRSSRHGIGQVVRGMVKGNRCLGSVSADQVDDGFEKLQLFLRMPDPATDNDAVPRPALECDRDPSIDVVAAVETQQTGFRMEAAVGKRRHADLDRVRHRLRIPWAGYAIGVETDDEDVRVRDHITHWWEETRHFACGV